MHSLTARDPADSDPFFGAVHAITFYPFRWLVGHFFSRLSFLFLSPSLWETARYRLKYCLKGPLSPKKPTNQPKNVQTTPRLVGWLVVFGLNDPLRQYFSLYRVVSQRGRKRRERIDESKNVQTTPTRTYCKSSRPLRYSNPNK